MSWQPIATAPQTGRNLLLIDRENVLRIGYMNVQGFWRETVTLEMIRPTHWLDIPPSPHRPVTGLA